MPYHKKTSIVEPSSDGGDTTDVSIPPVKRQETFGDEDDQSMDSAAYTGPLPLRVLTANTSSTDAQYDGITPTAAICGGMREVSLSQKCSTSSFSDGNQADGEKESDVDSERTDSPLFVPGAEDGSSHPTYSVKVILSKAEGDGFEATIKVAQDCERYAMWNLQTRVNDLCFKCDLSAFLPQVDIDDAWGQATELLKGECQEAVKPGSAGSYNFEFERDVSNLDDEACSRLATALDDILTIEHVSRLANDPTQG